MDVIRTISAGGAGTKRFQEIYGDKLICVRYRQDNNGNKFTTIELIVAENRSTTEQRPRLINPGNNRTVYLRIGYHETELRDKVKMAGGLWDKEKKLWLLRRRQVTALGLQARIVQI